MNRLLFRIYFVLQGVGLMVYPLVPRDTWAQAIWQAASGWIAAAAIVATMAVRRPVGYLAWYFLAAGLFFNGTGTFVEGVEARVFGITANPSWADPFWISLYPCLIAGMIVLIRLRTTAREWSTLVDTTTIITGLGLLSWVFLIHPATVSANLSTLGRVVVVAYPVGDIVVLAMLVRLLLGGGNQHASSRLMLSSMFSFLTADVAWAVWGHNVGQLPPDLLQCAFEMPTMLGFVLMGGAAVHPSSKEIAAAAPPQESRISPFVFLALTLASLIAPGLLMLQALRGRITDGLAIAFSSTVLFLLVVSRMAGLLRQVERQARQLLELARVDELTGLPNRRAWNPELALAIERARRDREPVSVVMIDLDHFKAFNDTYGHPAGDQLLKGAAAAWRIQLRMIDLLARYGGEEFIALLPSADGDQSVMIIERLQAVTPAGQTFSAGIATWNGSETPSELIARADAALYEAKKGGRHRSVIAPEPSTENNVLSMAPHR